MAARLYLAMMAALYLLLRGAGERQGQSSPPLLLEGDGYLIFQPLQFFSHSNHRQFVFTGKLLPPPHRWISSLQDTHAYLDTITVRTEPGSHEAQDSGRERAARAYLNVLVGFLTGSVYGDSERSVRFDSAVLPYNRTLRERGEDMSYLGLTMVGRKRLWSLHDLLHSVAREEVAGNYVETGVWRGGASIFAAAAISILQESTERRVFLCDSFQGWPEGSSKLHPGDVGWNGIKYASVPDRTVARNFNQMGLLSENIVFAKGFFNATMPVLARVVDRVAVLRLDGDMYSSTVDVLYHLYDKVSVGGFVIIDDWEGFPAKEAVQDFLAVHRISAQVVPVDDMSVYWKKTDDVIVQKWRLEKRQFKD
jgi:O-methyltransferase